MDQSGHYCLSCLAAEVWISWLPYTQAITSGGRSNKCHSCLFQLTPSSISRFRVEALHYNEQRLQSGPWRNRRRVRRLTPLVTLHLVAMVRGLCIGSNTSLRCTPFSVQLVRTVDASIDCFHVPATTIAIPTVDPIAKYSAIVAYLGDCCKQ